MKKTILIMLMLLAIATGMAAQGERGYLGISLGPSIPIGEFAEQDPDNESAGFADLGAMVDLSLVYRIGKGQYGVTAMVRSQLNPVDEEALFSDVLQEPGISFDTEGGRWGMRTALLGAFGSVAFSDKISFHARVMAGIVGVSSPNVEATVTGPAGTFIVEQSSENASAFGRLYGGGFTFNLGNKIALITNLDYFTATPEFSNVEVSINDIPFSTNQSLSQKVVTVNFSVGLGLKF